MEISQKQLDEFTSRPLLGILSTTNPYGAPRAMPVFYEYYDDTFNITTYADLFKVRNIRQNSKVCLVIVDTVLYGDTLTVSGTAEVEKDGVYEIFQRLNIRYLGRERGSMTKARYEKIPARVSIRITPTSLHYRRSMESPP